MDPISLEELALLDVLERIDQGLDHGPNAAPLLERLVDVGLLEKAEGSLGLTDARIQRCKAVERGDVRGGCSAEIAHRKRPACAGLFHVPCNMRIRTSRAPPAWPASPREPPGLLS